MRNSFYKVVSGFIASLLFIGNVSAQLSPNVTPTGTTCGHNNGSAVANPTGGSGYTYQWSCGCSNTNTASGLASGPYTVTVYSIPISDSVVAQFNIAASTGIQVFLQSDTMPRCGQINGSILCSVSAGTGQSTLNTFLKNDSIVESGGGTDYTHADTGTYIFFALDITTGCADTLPPIVLTDTSSYASFNGVAVTPDSCYGSNNGAITVTLGNCASGCTYSWAHIPSDNTPTATGLTAGLDTFYVSKGGCTNLDTVINVPGPLAPLADSLTTHPDHCSQNVGSAIVLTTGGTGPYIYNWSMGNSLGDSVSQLVGDSTVYVTVTDSHGCMSKDSGYVGKTPGPRANMTQSDTICGSDNTGILIVTPTSNDGPFTYLWSSGHTTSVDAGLAQGTYYVTVYNAVGCDTVLQGIVPAYIVQNTATVSPSATVTQGQTVTISLMTNVPYTSVNWDPYIPGSTNTLIASFVPTETTQYAVTVKYGQTCFFTDSFQIAVIPDTSNKIIIPNTFTPNGDGINDNFKLITYPAVNTFHIWIYDRWGNKVYESTDVDFNWNGQDQYAGDKPLDTGVYAYVVQYQTYGSGEKQTVGGNISLVR
jgi:gliding motility-associated-like protein